MKNPCNTCLVQAGCSKICTEKNDYFKHIIGKLIDLSPYLYGPSGHKRRKIPMEIKIKEDECTELLEKNQMEMQRILFRKFST